MYSRFWATASGSQVVADMLYGTFVTLSWSRNGSAGSDGDRITLSDVMFFQSDLIELGDI